jgi:hypothetical protein
MSESYLCFALASSDSAHWHVGETGVSLPALLMTSADSLES